MITRQELEGQWNQVKGRLLERWGELNENELQQSRGSADQLVGVIQQKTGETRREIEEFLEKTVAGGASTIEEMTAAAREYTGKAADACRDQYDQVAERVEEGFHQAEDMVRHNPVESVAVAFGAGIITGVVLGLVLKSR